VDVLLDWKFGRININDSNKEKKNMSNTSYCMVKKSNKLFSPSVSLPGPHFSRVPCLDKTF
jgi:hypothetical protein